MDWNALLALARGGVETAPDVDGINVSRAVQDPINGMTRFMQKAQWSPKGGNWGHYYSEDAETLITAAFNEFDAEKRERHPHASSTRRWWTTPSCFGSCTTSTRGRCRPEVQGFVQAQSWFQDLTPVSGRQVGREGGRDGAHDPLAADLRAADRLRRQPGLLHAGLSGAGRPAADGAAAGRECGDDRDRQARLWLRQAVAGPVCELAVARGAWRFRAFGRDPASGVAGGRRRAGQHAGARCVCGAAVVLCSALGLARWRAARRLGGSGERWTAW